VRSQNIRAVPIRFVIDATLPRARFMLSLRQSIQVRVTKKENGVTLFVTPFHARKGRATFSY
jgi:hypothetical protein